MLAEMRHERRNSPAKQPVEQSLALAGQPLLPRQYRGIDVAAPIFLGADRAFLQQAIEQMAPDDVMPSDSKAAEAKMARWIDRFSGPCSVPADLETARAFRKRGDVAENEQAELDELERQLKDEIKKEHEGEA